MLDRNNNREADLLPWQISQLKYKIMILVNSLWESNQNAKTISRLMRTIPLDVLKDNIAEIYRQYQATYGKVYSPEAFGHVY